MYYLSFRMNDDVICITRGGHKSEPIGKKNYIDWDFELDWEGDYKIPRGKNTDIFEEFDVMLNSGNTEVFIDTPEEFRGNPAGFGYEDKETMYFAEKEA